MVLSTPAVLKQPNDYSCGVTALKMLLRYRGYSDAMRAVSAEALGTTERDGTSHGAITRWLERQGIPWASYSNFPLSEIPMPCLVNYQWCRDGHYAVAFGIRNGKVEIHNPGNGWTDYYKISEFNKRWFSKRYGPRWALTVGD